MKFHHIGYLTTNFKNSINDFKKINYKIKGRVINDKLLKVNIQFIQNTNNIIELVKPHKRNYGLNKIIKKKNYAYHFAYKVKKLSIEIKKIKKKKFKLIVNPIPAKAFNNKKVAFLKMKDDFIIELIES
jgi:methylmalonyl-CoA/ethylmalonyl-CoA epimerase